jgi:glycosyltransferase involved in cell wall biosynthesis
MAYLASVHQIIDYMSWGDATSNHMLLLRNLLRGWGIRSEIYVLGCDPRLTNACRPLRECQLSREDRLIYQYSLDSALTEFALAHPAQTILNYHNISPPLFFSVFDPPFAGRLKCAAHDLKRMTGLAQAVSESRYNCGQLEEFGFSCVHHLPLLFSLDMLRNSVTSPRGRSLYQELDDGCQKILFVGRVAPNKRFEDLIRAFHYYHQLVEPASRLLLVGASPHGVYQAYLDMLVESLDLIDSVTFAGRVPLVEGFGAFYQSADVFLCLSEHEGFGVPLVESMYFDLPVIAYKSSAVPETLADCGVLVTEKHYDVIGELIYNLMTDQALRQQVIRKQRERLAAFDQAVIEGQVKAWVESLENA